MKNSYIDTKTNNSNLFIAIDWLTKFINNNKNKFYAYCGINFNHNFNLKNLSLKMN